MDLKDVVQDVKYRAEEAHSAFHAGHPENAEKELYAIEKLVVEYLRMPATPAGDVTESPTSEKPNEVQTETPAEVPGAPVQPGAVNPADAARSVGTGSAEPTQPQ